MTKSVTFIDLLVSTRGNRNSESEDEDLQGIRSLGLSPNKTQLNWFLC